MRVILALALVPLFAAAEAPACSIVVPWHETSDEERKVDQSDPTPPVVVLESIRRGHARDRGESGSIVMTSCDDIGFITIRLQQPAHDDRTPSSEMGYLLRVVEGNAPEEIMPLDRAVRAGEGILHMHWIDGATNDQEPLDFTIAIVPVDAAGNEGDPVELKIRTP